MTIGTAEDVVASTPRRLFIGGTWCDAATAATLEVEDPATGEALCEVADAGPEDARRALDAAVDAQAAWACSDPRRRSDILRAAYEAVLARTDELALLMTLEMGKPLAESRGEVAYAADFLRWFSEEAVRVDGRLARGQHGRGRMAVTRHPVGPCLLITPWNFPLAMGTRKIGPAIAAGCTMVVKPARQTPLSMLALTAILAEAGLPPGVLNVIVSSTAGPTVEPLLADARLRKLSFTGSTEVGRHLVRLAADNLLRVSAELGGNAPFIVFEDADVDEAVAGAMLAKLRNGGEACTAANRFLVHEAVADAFTRALAGRMAAILVGPGTAEGIELGPLIDARQRDDVAALVADALARGATLAGQGMAPDGPGHFYPPTVLADVPAGARVLEEEVFGPVAPVITFRDDAEAIALANATEYGLVAYVYTRDVARALDVCDELEVGMAGVNQGLVSNAAAPFGGVKHSGFGREGGVEGIEEYLAPRYVAIAGR